uniref:Vacuolar protein-sorting-associated protein 25 n=1 Tax=Stegastes partitus TaxID=144197 RepID=A0A3B5AYI5_9TELE
MSFEWPWQYNFPPFFTLQPNVDTRQKQLVAWCSLALSYCRHHKLYTLDVMEAQESPVFNNKKIERKLSMEAIQVVFEELRKKGNLEWLDKNKSRCLVMWRRPEEWGKLIYQWVSRQTEALILSQTAHFRLFMWSKKDEWKEESDVYSAYYKELNLKVLYIAAEQRLQTEKVSLWEQNSRIKGQMTGNAAS